MAKKLAFERYLWFHAQLKQKRYPKLRDLEEKFEISKRQAAREIEFMRDFFSAPIEYSSDHNGYFYSEESFELPGLWVSEEEIISLIISKRLSGTIPNKTTQKKIQTFFKKIYQYVDFNFQELEDKISLKNIHYYKVKPSIFEAVLFGLSKDRKLKITYQSVYNKSKTERIVNPLHMLLYMGNWHLMAYCETRKQVRNFVLSRITHIEILMEPVDESKKEKDLQKQINESYGIFLKGEKKEISLKFNPSISQMVKEQVWFPGQKMKDSADGSVLLSFPVSDFREVIRDILRFGAEVEVIDPEELRIMIKDTIQQMKNLYNL